VPEWLGELGVDLPERIHESGLMYLSRWYRLPPDYEFVFDPKLGGDLGFVKFLGIPGDAGTLSVTLAVRTDDAELRGALAEPERFDLACRLLPGPDRFFAAGPLAPLGGVRPMGGLLNRVRHFLDDGGLPRVVGFHAVGDAHTCTNPLYGRGCSLAAVQAVALADAVTGHDGDPVAAAVDYERFCAREVEPWFEVSVQMDQMGADPAGVPAGGGEGNAMASVFVAAATDPVIGRGLARFWNLLSTPAELAADADFTGRVMEILADPSAYPVPPREGPTREQLLDALTTTGATAPASEIRGRPTATAQEAAAS
jgi:hypothetical protein